MNNNYPFHYELRFRLLAIDENNNVKVESKNIKFDDKTPIENRANAFKEFNLWLSYIQKRLKKNRQGNFQIIQPFSSSALLEKIKETNSIEENLDILSAYEQYKQELSVYLVVDELVAKNVIYAPEYDGKVQTEFEIHKVSSYADNAQDLIDNLDIYELPLFEYYKINIDDLKTTVYHYGVDYAESGEDEEDGAKRIILKTPFIWTTKEQYYEEQKNLEQTTEETKPAGEIDWLSVIERGESNQVEFKSSLVYNFKTKKAGISVKYIIAKAICGFLNSNGGIVFIGVRDDGQIQGLEVSDYLLFPKEKARDKILLEFDNLISYFFNFSKEPDVKAKIEKIKGKDVLLIRVYKSEEPVFLKNKRNNQIEKEFYVRGTASTRKIDDIEEMGKYILNNWKKFNS